MIPFLESINVPYFIEEAGRNGNIKSLRRASIYQCARREGYNVVALGHNLDDLAESFIKSSFHFGQITSMRANYTINKGDLRVIRPLVSCR